MILFHVDRTCSLVKNQVLTLNQNIKLESIFEIYENSFSSHGLNYLNQYNDSSVWELCLEFVRLNNFPHLPSRLKSIFGVSTLKEAIYWKGYFSANINSPIQICKIECTNSYEFDARWLSNFPKPNNPSNYSFDSPSIAKMLEAAYKYWSQEKTFNPMLEHIITLPAKVVDININ